MRVIFVPGDRLLSDGSISRDFQKRLVHGIYLLDRHKKSVMVISGGITQPGANRSEARRAYGHIPADLKERVILEEEALSTRQNVMRVRDMLRDTHIEVLDVVSNSAHLKRVVHHIRREWPDVSDKIVWHITAHSRVRQRLVQRVHSLVGFIDPHEHIFNPLKMWARRAIAPRF